MDNDIALIELERPFVLGAAVSVIPLLSLNGESNLLQSGTPLIVIGWGRTTESGQTVRDLRYADVPLVDRVSCNRPLGYDNQVTTNMICAGIASGGKDACQGDSGGPLTVSTEAKPELAGIVSWGIGCARPNKPGVYTRVANYSTWVADCVARPAECH